MDGESFMIQAPIVIMSSQRHDLGCILNKCTLKKKALTFVLSSLLFTATVQEGLFGEYHSSSAALGQQRPEVTKQPLVRDCSATSEALCDVNCRFAQNTETLFMPFVGPDGSSHHYGGHFLHLGAATTHG